MNEKQVPASAQVVQCLKQGGVSLSKFVIDCPPPVVSLF